jgi:hypothetical protein
MMAEAIQELKKWDPAVIVLLHFTGSKGNRVRFLTTGDYIEF